MSCKIEDTYSEEPGGVEVSHTNTIAVELTSLPRSVSDIDVTDNDSSSKMHTIATNKVFD